MARAAKSTKKRKSQRDEGAPTKKILGEWVGVFALILAAFSLLALSTYVASDPMFSWTQVGNRAGVAGATLAGLLMRGFGYAGAMILLGAIAAVGARLLFGRGLPIVNARFWVGVCLLLFSVTASPPLLASVSPERFGSIEAGLVGGWIAGVEGAFFGDWGSLLLNGLLFGLGCLSLVDVTLASAFAAAGRGSLVVARGARQVTLLLVGATIHGTRIAWNTLCRGASGVQVFFARQARRRRVSAMREHEAELPGAHEMGEEPPAVMKSGSVKGAKRSEPTIVDHAAEQRKKIKPEQEAFVFDEGGLAGPFRLPDSSLFDPEPEGAAGSYDRESLLMNSRILEKKLQDFNVSGRVVAVHPGPVITMYEFEPAPGVKVGSIVRLSDDLSLALRALSIRIVAPIPGKAVVGIEIPNKERDTVGLRSLFESTGFRKSSSHIPLALGKDIFGTPIAADLTKMPHLLVAGATGTGKSVFLNSLITSVLMRARPDEVKLLLIDPKMLELSIYQGIPHLIADVVTDPKRASAALHGLVRKMEERYKMMAAIGVRNISQFNVRVDEALAAGETTFCLKDEAGKPEGLEVEYARLPYIVVIIDELADLMMISAKTVEDALQRLAQMARASGIHLVLATQRPSVDVLTGVIKANFPSRISFQVSQRTDSRTILDSNGAEDLLGDGDMLYLPPGTAKLQRIHGPFVSEQEVARLVQFLTDQAKPVFDEDLIKAQEQGLPGEGPLDDDDIDEMFDMAVQIVAESRNASISYIQRRLKVGYNRSARMIEQMEQQGMIGPQIGNRPREVLLPEAAELADDEY